MSYPIVLEGLDLFCGAGGTTTGVHEAMIDNSPIAKVVACINHDEEAIASHKANHPEAIHFTEDIREFDTFKLPPKNPEAYSFIWASLECTNFSNAKGGLPRDADSRTLAEHLYRYIEAYDPDYIMIENVREFMAWGPLDVKGKPVSRLKGSDYLKWISVIKSYGYHYDKRLLNAADFGAFTSRVRYFGIFAKEGLPIVFPQPTHAKKPVEHLEKWKAVREVLNLEEKGESIFTRKKPLVENTLKRIYAGLVKHVANGDDAFIKKYFSGKPAGKVIPLHGPAGTVTTIDHQTLVQLQFLQRYYSGNHEHRNHSIEEPAGTVRTNNCMALVSADFFVKYHGTALSASIDEVASTITTKDRLAIINTEWLDKQYSGDLNHQSINKPAGSITTNPKFNLVQVDKHWIMDQQFANTGKSIDQPSQTLIARMDKKPPYVISVEGGLGAILIKADDSETMKKIKLFMAAYGLIDIKMRMLFIDELKRIQGLGDDYFLKGNKTQQKKFIGNAVHPVIPKFWFETLARQLMIYQQSQLKSA